MIYPNIKFIWTLKKSCFKVIEIGISEMLSCNNKMSILFKNIKYEYRYIHMYTNIMQVYCRNLSGLFIDSLYIFFTLLYL